MNEIKTDSIVPWETFPAPWNWIGLEFRAEAKAIARGEIPPTARHPRQYHAIGIIKRLEEAMRSRGMTRQYVARRLGFHPQTITRWLSGAESPAIESVRVIDEFLNRLEAGQE